MRKSGLAAILPAIALGLVAAAAAAESRLAVTGYTQDAYDAGFRDRLSDFLTKDPPIRDRGIGILVTWYADGRGKLSRTGRGGAGDSAKTVSTPDYASVAEAVRLVSRSGDRPGLLLYVDPASNARAGRYRLTTLDFPDWTKEILALAKALREAKAEAPSFVLLSPELTGIESRKEYDGAWRALVRTIKGAWEGVELGYCFKGDSPALFGSPPPWTSELDSIGSTCIVGGDSYQELSHRQSAIVSRVREIAAASGKRPLIGEWGFTSSAATIRAPYSTAGFPEAEDGPDATTQARLYADLLPRMADDGITLTLWRFSSFLPTNSAEYAPSDTSSRAGGIVRAFLAKGSLPERVDEVPLGAPAGPYVPPLKWIQGKDGSYSLSAPIRARTIAYRKEAAAGATVFCDLEVEQLPGTSVGIERSKEGEIPSLEIVGKSLTVRISGYLHRSEKKGATLGTQVSVFADAYKSGSYQQIRGWQQNLGIPSGGDFDLSRESPALALPPEPQKYRLRFYISPGDSLASVFGLRVTIGR